MPQTAWLRLEVDVVALRHNIGLFRRLLPETTRLLAVVKADGYGHGLSTAAAAFLDGGADLLGVHSLDEGLRLREGGVTAPILVLGPLLGEELLAAAAADLEVTIASPAAAAAAAAVASGLERPLRCHLKVETGVNRQGILEQELAPVLADLTGSDRLRIVALSSHFADIEDTTDHTFARAQAERFAAWRARLRDHGLDLPAHMSCSAAAILWPEAHHDIARVGIAAYGVWPSRETLVSARAAGRLELSLRPAMTWRCRIAQVRTVPAGETVGYGRTWKAPADSRIAVLPVGYSDGYPRALSNRAHVLVRGRRAPVRGRVCMNLTLVDVTHIPGVEPGDDAVLLGRQDDEVITPEMLAGWLGTIPYEVLTLPRETWRRIPVEGTRE